MEDGLRDSVQQVLATHLPDYRQHRQNFPLWTYRRSLHELPSWSQVRFWPERLRWAQLFPVFRISEELRCSAEKEGFDEVHARFPTRVDLIRRGDEVDGEWHLREADASTRIPLRLETRFRAAYAATGVKIPDEPREIRLPSDVAATWILDPHDWRELADRLVGTLFGGAGFGVTEDGTAVAVRTEPAETPGLMRGDYFARLTALAAESFQALGDESEQEKLAARRKTLATEYLTETGLIAERRGGANSTLPEGHLNTLRREARALVKEVRAYRPSREKVNAMVALVEDDRELRNLNRETKGYGDPILERLRRTTEDATHPTDRPPLPWLLQFPFLSPDEQALCRDLDGRAEERGLSTPLQVGDRLIECRLLPESWSPNSILDLAGPIS